MQHKKTLKFCIVALASIMLFSVFSPAVFRPVSAQWICSSEWSTPEPQSWTDPSKCTSFGVAQQIANYGTCEYGTTSIACDVSDCAVHDHTTQNYDTLSCHIAIESAVKDEYKEDSHLGTLWFDTNGPINPSYTSIDTGNYAGNNFWVLALPSAGSFSMFLTAVTLAQSLVLGFASVPIDPIGIVTTLTGFADAQHLDRQPFTDLGIHIRWDSPLTYYATWGVACFDLTWNFWRGASPYDTVLHQINLKVMQTFATPTGGFAFAEATVTLRVTTPPFVEFRYPLSDQILGTGCSSMPLKVSVFAFKGDNYWQWNGVDIICQKGNTATTYATQYDSYTDSWYANVILDSGTPKNDYIITARVHASSGAYFDTSIVVHVQYVSQPIAVSITSPHDGEGFVTNGASYAPITVTCVATAGQNCPPISRVDVSVDGNWYSATHGSGDQWSVTIPFSAGRPAIQHSISAKATNTQGSTQSTATIHISVLKGWPNVN
jgi:hypothetical protein